MAAKKLEMGASHILLKHSGSVNPVCKRNGQPITLSKEEARAEAEEVKSTLSTDNFSEIAGSRSDCSSFIRGGISVVLHLGRWCLNLKRQSVPFKSASYRGL